MTGLRARFAFEGALLHDLSVIIVDGDAHKRINRYRFTLAHELGHRILHGDYISSLTFEEAEDWKDAVKGMNAEIYGRMEFQASAFAGHILVPTSALQASCSEAQAKALRHGIDLSFMGEEAIGYVAGSIAKEFNVSTEVVTRRLSQEKIIWTTHEAI